MYHDDFYRIFLCLKMVDFQRLYILAGIIDGTN